MSGVLAAPVLSTMNLVPVIPTSINIHNCHLWESWGRGRGVPRVRMGRKRERECSPWKKGENECAMSAPRNQDRMVPPSNATPSRGGPEGGGVPVQTESPDTSVSGGGRPEKQFKGRLPAASQWLPAG